MSVLCCPHRAHPPRSERSISRAAGPQSICKDLYRSDLQICLLMFSGVDCLSDLFIAGSQSLCEKSDLEIG